MIDPQLERAGWYLLTLYEPPLDMFGAHALERWFKEKELVKRLILPTEWRYK
jgi:hypothetical protein